MRLCKASRDPASLDEGEYDVVIEPEAVAELLEWLAAIAVAAPEVEQGTSPLAGRLGERITGEGVDIVEDPLDPSRLGFGVPFDREGTWRRRVPIVEKGVARAVLYDRTYGARAGAGLDRERAPALDGLGGRRRCDRRSRSAAAAPRASTS